MYNRRFFQTRLGIAAAISISAMMAFNILALSSQLHAQPMPLAAGAQMVELA
jgi:hypothetical protein